MMTKEQIQSKRQFPNPLVEQRADPWIYKHTDGYYYFTASVPAYDCIELRRARTIQELSTAEPVVIWRKHEKGRMSGHIWAPELHYIEGKWYIYFAAGGSDEYETAWEICMYVLENDAANPLEPTWVEKGQLRTNWDSFSLDATTFEHRGVRYLVWAQYKEDQVPICISPRCPIRGRFAASRSCFRNRNMRGKSSATG